MANGNCSKFTPASPCIARKEVRRRRIVKQQDLVWSLLFHDDQSQSVTLELFIGVVQILIENFCHSEHVDSILLEDSTHSIVASNLAAIAGVLKLVLANILPNFFDSLGSRKLGEISKTGPDDQGSREVLTVGSPRSADRGSERFIGFCSR